MHDALGDRMKRQYESRARYLLPRRTYTVVRVDGKAFHSFARHCAKPFDDALMAAMDATAVYLCAHAQGSQWAFVQSDEISVLLTDFDKTTTDAWFDGNVQKIASISASIATAGFRHSYPYAYPALFDARCFTIPDPIEVENYFVWRQQDATRNSIQMVAHSLYSHGELNGKNVNEQQEMIFARGVNWNDYPARYKRGRVAVYRDTAWVIEEPPVFTQDRTYLTALVPRQWAAA